MPGNITDVDAFTDPLTQPIGSDTRNASSIQTALQKIANRTRYLYNEIISRGPGIVTFARSQLGVDSDHTANTFNNVQTVTFAQSLLRSGDILRIRWTGKHLVTNVAATGAYKIVVDPGTGSDSSVMDDGYTIVIPDTNVRSWTFDASYTLGGAPAGTFTVKLQAKNPAASNTFRVKSLSILNVDLWRPRPSPGA